LAPREATVPAWDSLPADERALYERHMETYAAMLECVDQNVGSLVDLLRDMGELDNTIFVVSADNGGTHAGGVQGAIHFNRRFAGLASLPVAHELTKTQWIGSGRVNPLYPMGWAQLSNTPFPAYKTQTGAGGRRVACIVSWPAKLPARGELRTQFAHVTDLMPTLLDLAGVPVPTVSHGKPAVAIQGKSQAAVLRSAQAPAARNEQYYECWSNRGYYRDGWVAVSIQKLGQKLDFDNWVLHRHATDFSERVDLAAQHPDKLTELVEAFDQAAWANQVYPLDNRLPVQKFQQLPPQMQPPAAGSRRFLPGAQTVNRFIFVPLVADRSFCITTNIEHQADNEGVLWALGDVAGGMVLYIEAGMLQLFYNGFGEYTRHPSIAMPTGVQAVALEFEALGRRAGRGRFLINGQPVGDWSTLSPTLMGGFHEGFDIGIDRRAPVDWELFERRGNFAYSGRLRDVIVESRQFAPDSAYAKG
jgi:arylsulfatase